VAPGGVKAGSVAPYWMGSELGWWGGEFFYGTDAIVGGQEADEF